VGLSGLFALGASLFLTGCGGGSGSNGGGGGGGGSTSYTITVNSSTPSSGVSISYGNSLTSLVQSGTTSFTVTEASGTTIIFSAPATLSNGNTFDNWSGCTSTSADNCTLTVSSNTTITANYSTPAPTVYTLTVDSANPASGVAITASPADNNKSTGGNTALTLSYNSGTQVTLTAPATSGANTFTSWTGCASTSGETCTVTMSANTTVTANYSAPAPTTYTLTVDTTNPSSGVAITANLADINGHTSGSSPFSLTYASGATVILTAPATSGSNTFSSWTGCTSTSGAACTVTLSANTTITANYSTPTATVYLVTVDSASPASGAAITATPADNTGISSGTTPLTLRYNAGTAVTLTASSAAGGNGFSSWSGCAASTNPCALTVNANATVTATYSASVPAITISPSSGSITIGNSQQFTVTVTGLSGSSVTWSVAAPSGTPATVSPGTITSAGLYQSPYPAPASVTVTATSTVNTSVSASVTMTLVAPAAAAGPALAVNVGSVTRPISPLIYGMNGYLLDPTTAQTANITVARWGGDDTSRYNYQTNVVNSANDYYFENFSGSNSMLPNGATGASTNFNDFLSAANTLGITALGTAPVIGWVSNSTVNACSFPKSKYPGQTSYDPSGNCGNGVYADGSGGCTTTGGCSISGDASTPPLTSIEETPPTAPGASGATAGWAQSTWTGGWVNCLLTKGTYCTGANGKDAAIWDLDNEPGEWDAVHRDVHPLPQTYDELTNGGIGTALAIKLTDPNAQVSGPVIDLWWNYFYSKQDIDNGYAHGIPGANRCYVPWADPTDREAHGGTPMIEYYLQQMASASATYGMRLLDYVDVHAYFEAAYNGTSVGFTTAGDTGEQEARMNSTRVFWDPTYTDPNLPQPNYTTDSNYETTSCTPPPQQGPAIITTLESWVTKDYPGTKTSIDEYNFGGLESINGAVTQADVLGIFGMYGLDMGVFWPTSPYIQSGNMAQPGATMAFAIYRNYDGNKSVFGDQALTSTSTATGGNGQGQLAVYGALRSSDNAVTIIVINKTYGPLTSTLSVNNLTGTATSAQVYQYSNANLNAIVAQPAAAITPPASGGTTSTISATFPGQSITLLVIPQ
jgi:hypothetical protein